MKVNTFRDSCGDMYICVASASFDHCMQCTYERAKQGSNRSHTQMLHRVSAEENQFGLHIILDQDEFHWRYASQAVTGKFSEKCDVLVAIGMRRQQ